MPYYVKMRRNGRLCGKLGPFSTQKLAVKQAQPLADDAADDVVVTVEPAATSNPKAKKTNTRKTRKKTGMTWRLERKKEHPFAPVTSKWVRGDPRVWGSSEDSMLYRERFPTKKEAKAFVSRVKRAPGTWMVRPPEDSGQRFHVYPNGVGVGGWLVVYIADHEVSSRRRRNYSPVPGSPPLASATDSLVDWSPMNARTARSMERMGMAPRKKNSRGSRHSHPGGFDALTSLIKSRFGSRGFSVDASLTDAHISYPASKEFELVRLLSANGYDPQRARDGRIKVELYEPGYRKAPRRRNGRRRNSTATKLHVYGWDDAGVRQAQHLAQRMRGQILDSGVEFDAEGDPEDFFIAKFPSAKAADAFRAAVPWSQGVKLARRRANPRRAPMPRGRAGTVRQGTLKLGK